MRQNQDWVLEELIPLSKALVLDKDPLTSGSLAERAVHHFLACCSENELSINEINVDNGVLPKLPPLHKVLQCVPSHANPHRYLPGFPGVRQEDMVNLIILMAQNGYDLNRTSPLQENALVTQAIMDGCDKVVNCLLSHGVNVNTKNSAGISPLHGAVYLGFDQIVGKLLTQPHIDVNIVNNLGRTPLHQARTHNGMNAIKQLVNAGADLNLEDKTGQTALDSFMKSDGPDSEVVLFLAGARLAQQEKNELEHLCGSVKEERAEPDKTTLLRL